MSKSGCFIAEEEYLGDILWWVRVREKCQGVTSLTSPQLGRSLLLVRVVSVKNIVSGEDN